MQWQNTGRTVCISNGRIKAVLHQATARVISYQFDGTEMVDPREHIYYSMDGGPRYTQPRRCRMEVRQATPELVELAFLQPADLSSAQVFDLEIYYVLRRGDTGLYSYAVLAHPAHYPETSVGEFRLVWKLPHDRQRYRFDLTYVDENRTGDWGTYADFAAAQKTEIPEVSKLLTGARAGHYDCKYQFAARYSEVACWGHASESLGKGTWIVLGDQDFFNDGPTKQELTLAENYNLVHLNRNHFGGSSIQIAEGQAWRKFFGPFLLYCNATEAGKEAGERLWQDARARQVAEKEQGPAPWLEHPDYPQARARGAVNGRLVIDDPLKPHVNAARAWVGLAAPQEAAGNWQDQALGYQFWVRADDAGSFTIPQVRPGRYTLYAFNQGAVGEYSRKDLEVRPGGTVALGEVRWRVPHHGRTIAWEIGTPDRTAREFLGGAEFTEPFIWKTFAAQRPNPLVFTIGTSDPQRDWNFVHSGYLGFRGWERWPWEIRFDLIALPAKGDAVLTLALASAHEARLEVLVNGDSRPLAQFDLTAPGGNALVRQGTHAKYRVESVAIPVSRLRSGTNTITLVQTRATNPSAHVMYDYLSLELPGGAAARTVPGVTSIRNSPAQGSAPPPQEAENERPSRRVAR